MLGIITNVLAVILGGLFGTVFGSKLKKDFTDKLTSIFGICAIGMGISSIVLMQNMPAVILAITLGSAFGLLIHLGDLITSCGEKLQKPFARLMGSNSNMSKEDSLAMLVTAMVLFCTSGTGIYGCLDAGMTGNVTILLSKSILDFFTAAIFACSLGAVVSAIAIPQITIFSLLFLGAKVILPLTTPMMINDFKACCGFLLVATGLRIAKIKDFPIADMIPAAILALPFSALWVNYIAPLL